jgi:hypothetical protein
LSFELSEKNVNGIPTKICHQNGFTIIFTSFLFSASFFIFLKLPLTTEAMGIGGLREHSLS